MSGRLWLILGALVAGSAVGCGALGAHWFAEHSQALYSDSGLRERRVDNWKTAADYQLFHGLAIVSVGLAVSLRTAPMWKVAGALFVVGVLLFSGSLYAISLSGIADFKTSPGWYIAIAATPLGGLCLLAGWTSFLIAAANSRPASGPPSSTT